MDRLTEILKTHRTGALLALLIVSIVTAMVFPFSPGVLDIFLVISFAGAMLLVFVAAYASNPLQMSAFPGLLILATLFRLGLNVATTRLILSDAYAGEVVEAFGEWTVRGNLAVGVTVFLILVAVNFLVVTKGFQRMAEVAARFQVDALAPKHMAVDGDLNAGLVKEEDVARRREEIDRTADFFGVMDGAAKAVRGDAILGLLLLAVNLLVGLYVGMVQRGLDFGATIDLYSRLTIGDGLVSVVPALFTAVAGMIVVSQAPAREDMGRGIFGLVTLGKEPLWIVSVLMLGFGLAPGLPFWPFTLAGAVVAGVAWIRTRYPDWLENPPEETEEKAVDPEAEARDADPLADVLHEDAITVDLGHGLLSLFRDEHDASTRATQVRKLLALDFGVPLPGIRFRNSNLIGPNDYQIQVRGRTVGEGFVYPRCLLAVDYGDVRGEVKAVLETTDPAEGLPARWIHEADRDEAEDAGYVVVEPQAVLFTHLRGVLQDHISSVFGRQELRDMLDRLKEKHPVLLENLIPEKIELSTLHEVLRSLLEEGIPVRDMVTILEAVTGFMDQARQMNIRHLPPAQITEHVRGHLRHALVQNHLGPDGTLRVIYMDEDFARAVEQLHQTMRDQKKDGAARASFGAADILNVQGMTRALEALEELQEKHVEGRVPLPVVVPAGIRTSMRSIIRTHLPRVPVLGDSELPRDRTVDIVALWNLPSTSTETA